MKALDKAIRMCDSAYTRYMDAIMSEDYKVASRLYRQAEQDDDLTDNEVNKLLIEFKNKFGKGPA